MFPCYTKKANLYTFSHHKAFELSGQPFIIRLIIPIFTAKLFFTCLPFNIEYDFMCRILLMLFNFMPTTDNYYLFSKCLCINKRLLI